MLWEREGLLSRQVQEHQEHLTSFTRSQHYLRIQIWMTLLITGCHSQCSDSFRAKDAGTKGNPDSGLVFEHYGSGSPWHDRPGVPDRQSLGPRDIQYTELDVLCAVVAQVRTKIRLDYYSTDMTVAHHSSYYCCCYKNKHVISVIDGELSDIGCDTQRRRLRFPWKPGRLLNSSATIFKRDKWSVYLFPLFHLMKSNDLWMSDL